MTRESDPRTEGRIGSGRARASADLGAASGSRVPIGARRILHRKGSKPRNSEAPVSTGGSLPSAKPLSSPSSRSIPSGTPIHPGEGQVGGKGWELAAMGPNRVRRPGVPAFSGVPRSVLGWPILPPAPWLGLGKPRARWAAAQSRVTRWDARALEASELTAGSSLLRSLRSPRERPFPWLGFPLT